MRSIVSLAGAFIFLHLMAHPGSAQVPSVSDECSEAFAAASDVSPFQDTHEDLFPAYSACSSIEEWEAANEMYPDAIDGVAPVPYAMTVCASNQERLGDTPICRAVNEPDESVQSDLGRSEETGLLGAPLPEGAELLEQTPGTAGPNGRDPRERYRVSASATEISAFFDHEMVEAGWTKDGTSTETMKFFQEGDRMLGVLINGDGGTFTLMGS